MQFSSINICLQVTYWLESERKGAISNPGAVGGAMSYRAMMESQSGSLEQQQQPDQPAVAANGLANPPTYRDYNQFGSGVSSEAMEQQQQQQSASQSLVNVDVS